RRGRLRQFGERIHELHAGHRLEDVHGSRLRHRLLSVRVPWQKLVSHGAQAYQPPQLTTALVLIADIARTSECPRSAMCGRLRKTIAPRRSRPTKWNVFLPRSRPIVDIVVRTEADDMGRAPLRCSTR